MGVCVFIYTKSTCVISRIMSGGGRKWVGGLVGERVQRYSIECM